MAVVGFCGSNNVLTKGIFRQPFFEFLTQNAAPHAIRAAAFSSDNQNAAIAARARLEQKSVKRRAGGHLRMTVKIKGCVGWACAPRRTSRSARGSPDLKGSGKCGRALLTGRAGRGAFFLACSGRAGAGRIDRSKPLSPPLIGETPRTTRRHKVSSSGVVRRFIKTSRLHAGAPAPHLEPAHTSSRPHSFFRRCRLHSCPRPKTHRRAMRRGWRRRCPERPSAFGCASWSHQRWVQYRPNMGAPSV